jgi:hypothetical protein
MLSVARSRFSAHAALIALSLVSSSACSGELDPGADTELDVRDSASSGDIASKTVDGTQSAVLILKTGATLSIPSGAVTKATRVGLERPPDRAARELIGDLEASRPFAVASAPYILTPHGATFARGVTLTLPVAPGAGNAPLAVLWLEDESDRTWKVLGTPVRRGDRATFQLDHFSVVMLAATKQPLPVHSGAADGGVPDAQPGGDAALPATRSDTQLPDAGSEDAGLASCGPAEDGVFVARVIDPGQSSLPIAGISTVVVDDVTGLPIMPPIQAVSSREGCVRLPIGSLARFGIKALGNSVYTDSYTFHFDAAEPLIRVGSNALVSVFPIIAQYEPRHDSAPVVGTVYWKTSAMQSYDVIGCAQIHADTDDLAQQELRYFATSLPSPLAEWPQALGTNPSNGRFLVGNMQPGARMLTARLPNGVTIGATRIVTFPRSQASTQVDGFGQNLFFAPIFIDAPPGATKPGCSAGP